MKKNLSHITQCSGGCSGFFTRRVSDRNPTMINTVTSKNGITIRLTDERWAHITEEHCELAGLRMEVLETVFQPERILAGGEGELIAVCELEQGKFLVVVYRELVDDGFIITAFLTRRIRFLAKRKQLWP
ncbi:MAG TPA: hypothetical protein VE735_07000 [Gammaproteobacteria bacterium]|nr:hypothetical protein [Gammaproteobacteria bacterium]